MRQQQLHELLEQMTLHEKLAQLTQLTPEFFAGANESGEITGPMAWLGLKEEEVQNVGSVLGTHIKEEVIKIQETHLKNNRLGIPLMFMADVIHGYETIFPIPLAMGATWNEELVKEVAAISAVESSEAGVHVTFSPMVDLVRDARWGRVLESTGEDSYLNSVLAEAFVKGYQGEDGELASNVDKIAACVKHFVGYGAAEAGRDYNTVDFSVRAMYQTYLPAFVAAIDAGVKLVMTAFNTVDGMPATGNKWLMKDVLRNDLNFKGTLISDWGAVFELMMHGVAKDSKEAGRLAMDAGVDIEMMTSSYLKTLEESITEGYIKIEKIDESVMRVLSLKNELGLFEDPYRGLREERSEIKTFSQEHREAARKVITESIVLLKNENEVLPLTKDKKVALVGPLAKSHDLLGAWSWMGKKEASVTLEAGLSHMLSNLQVAGCESYESVSEIEMENIHAVASDADVIVVALGEISDHTGEAASLATIQLPPEQEQLLEKVAKLGKPIVTVIVAGRPLDLKQIEKYSDAILYAWFPGTEAGNGIAEIIMGEMNPSGKLPMSFPYTTGQIPIYYNHLKTGRPIREYNKDQKYSSRYLDIPNDPLYPFGYGLSYTNFEYQAIQQDKEQLNPGETLTFEFEIKNTGKCDGKEIVQFYVEDVFATVARPVRELKGFKKVLIPKDETAKVKFTLTETDLCYYHRDLTFSADAGPFNVYIGSDSTCEKCGEFTLVD